MIDFQKKFKILKSYCESHDFSGWDPYDGLNSKLFQALPFKHFYLVRLAWIQFLKRSPFKLRKLLLVPKQHNSKGIALFLSAYCNLFESSLNGNTIYGSKESHLKKIHQLADLLIQMQSTSYSGACWGYNFDWQSKAFFLPKNTPTIVATSFAVEALLKAYEISEKREYYQTAISSANFIKYDLNRIPKEDDLFMFSYSPLDNRAVYNASLLASKTLSLIYHYTKESELKQLAFKSISAVCKEQNEDGSFPHSDQVGQKWRDNFHTGFKLESIQFYQNFCSDSKFNSNLIRGFKYWINNFFDSETGFTYYYDRNMNQSLVDLHCVAQALSTLHKLSLFNKNQELIKKITFWAIENMQDKNGYYYFQKK